MWGSIVVIALSIMCLVPGEQCASLELLIQSLQPVQASEGITRQTAQARVAIDSPATSLWSA